jgi:N-acetylated-alpha-linked acidic dipeptidase
LNSIRWQVSCFLILCLAHSTVAQTIPAAPGGTTRLYGYTTKSSAAQREWEKKFQDGIVPANMRNSMQRLAARPHHVGSPYDKDNAEWILARFKESGFDAHIESFQVLFPTPKERVVEMLAPTPFRAKLQEPVLAIDPTSNQTAEQLPTYNAYSIDGDVTGPLVYVNYGRREDYEDLDRLGISVKGAIVIARYGKSWRGIKPKVAGERGAIGCIIYSDPEDDGYYNGDDYPKGGYRPKEGVQRGSVMDTDHPGDPLTPGVGATPDAKRVALSEAKTITRIPVLPISYADALPLLSALTGPVAPEPWRGALPITYHVGPGATKVHLKVVSNWDSKPVYDVIATMRGSESPDQWVLRGNHHDAWVNGAEDPISGMVTVIEEARMLGELHKQGWNPKRTIIYCAWDGEEPGLLGSTEWVETHREDLQKHGVAYVNSDGNERGFFDAGGSHDLERLINDIAREITDPEKDISVWQRARLYAISKAKDQEEREKIRKRADIRIGTLGDGSDYTPFLDFAGVSALDIGYGGEPDADAYHSIYDDFYWYSHFLDPNFVYARALAQTGGTTVMRIADADLIPYEYAGLADNLAKYVTDLEKLLKDKQEEFAERNLELSEGLFGAVADPTKTSVPPPHENVPPFMNFAPLKNGVEAVKKSAERYQAALANAQKDGAKDIPSSDLAAVNLNLMTIQRTFLTQLGLPRRPWFKHAIYAPGAYTGYGAKPMAAVREYMDEKKWAEADAQVPALGKVLQDVAVAIDSATDQLEKAAAHP